MKWFKYLRASYDNLIGPNFERAPQYDLTLSGTQVSFNNPLQTAFAGEEPHRTVWDIYGEPGHGGHRFYSQSAIETPSHLDPIFYVNGVGDWFLTVFKTGWSYEPGFRYDGSGVLMCSVFVLRRTYEKDPGDVDARSLFNPANHESWMLRWNADYRENGEKPDILKASYNNTHWLGYHDHDPDLSARNYEWFTPITDDHLINIAFRPSHSFWMDGTPTHFVDCIERDMETFLRNFTVTLSAQDEARKRVMSRR